MSDVPACHLIYKDDPERAEVEVLYMQQAVHGFGVWQMEVADGSWRLVKNWMLPPERRDSSAMRLTFNGLPSCAQIKIAAILDASGTLSKPAYVTLTKDRKTL